MTILADIPHKGSMIKVEITDTYINSRGEKMVSVKALKGEPFISWTHGGWAYYNTTEVGVNSLKDVRQEETAPNLLAMALAQAKPQWHSGESVWIWRNNGNGAFLKEESGFVNLCLTGVNRSVPIFYLDPASWSWVQSKNVEQRYQNWVSRVRAR